jgi:murein DD-endopeptidase MepM/ murein hydrolase activator NlpD
VPERNGDRTRRIAEVGALVLVLALLAGTGAYHLSGGPRTPPATRVRVPARGSTARPGADVAGHQPRSTQARPAASVMSTTTPKPTASPRPSPTPTAIPDGPVNVSPPFFAFRRPFDSDVEVRASRYYPYGTTGNGEYLLHHGVDIGNALGTTIRTVADGVVVYAGRDTDQTWGPETDFYGQLVVVRHAAQLAGQPLDSLYGHVSRVLVAAGQAVRAGDPIAEVGAEGIALGPHLHLEVRTDPRDYLSTRNPELFLRPLPDHGTIVGRVLDGTGQPAPAVHVGLYAAVGVQAGAWLAQTTTYPRDRVNATTGWDENFVFGDTPVGHYVVTATIDGVRASAPVTLTSGSAWLVTLRPPTAVPAATDTAAATQTGTVAPAPSPTTSASTSGSPAATGSPTPTTRRGTARTPVATRVATP